MCVKWLQKRKDFSGQICNLLLENLETGTYICSFSSRFSQVGSTLHILRNFQVREGRKKNEGREKDVLKTSLIGTFIRNSNSDVFPFFQIEPNMNVFLWTSFVRILHILGPCVYWETSFPIKCKVSVAVRKKWILQHNAIQRN